MAQNSKNLSLKFVLFWANIEKLFCTFKVFQLMKKKWKV